MHFNKNDLPDELWSTRSGCKSWTIKKVEHRRIDAFELRCWRRLLRVPWTARRGDPEGNQSWIFIGRTDVETETPILWPPDVQNWLIWKGPEQGKNQGRSRRDNREWDGWMASPTWWTWVWVSSGSWWKIGKPGVLQSMGSQRVRHDCATELNWLCVWWGWHQNAFWKRAQKSLLTLVFLGSKHTIFLRNQQS